MPDEYVITLYGMSSLLSRSKMIDRMNLSWTRDTLFPLCMKREWITSLGFIRPAERRVSRCLLSLTGPFLSLVSSLQSLLSFQGSVFKAWETPSRMNNQRRNIYVHYHTFTCEMYLIWTESTGKNWGLVKKTEYNTGAHLPCIHRCMVQWTALATVPKKAVRS